MHLSFKLRVPPHVFLGHSREAATIIASVDGLIWKIWVMQEEGFEMGGIYLFVNREAAESHLDHPLIEAVRSNSNVVSTESRIWDVETSLSAITRAPLEGFFTQYSEPYGLATGGQ